MQVVLKTLHEEREQVRLLQELECEEEQDTSTGI